ncbi:RICIN domain-containing protein [Fodinicola acaciae]|uniref:RICIN domain-containing protein n=1 Tax=Fodinicola acaciae TaxID=2681555 RepID=UPI0013D18485|nr:RICIN domain-containing protein [Fodinicola acaciae]
MSEPDTVLDPDPRPARTAAEYVDLLRRLKDQSGLTYRQLEQKAAAAGCVLPRSTAATMLSRPSLPREELVTALVRATGGDESVAQVWVDVRKRLAAAPEEPPDTSAGRPGKSFLARFFGLASRPVWALVGALLTVFLLAGPGASLLQTRAQPTGEPSASLAVTPAVPPDGTYRLRLPRSGMCFSEDPANYSGLDFQTACAYAFPPIALEKQPTGTYHLATQHPKLGPGCVGVSHADPNPGAVVSNGYCDSGDAVEYTLEPVTVPLRGFRIHPVHSGLCLGVPNNSTRSGAPIRQLTCDRTAPGQVFAFDKSGG